MGSARLGMSRNGCSEPVVERAGHDAMLAGPTVVGQQLDGAVIRVTVIRNLHEGKDRVFVHPLDLVVEGELARGSAVAVLLQVRVVPVTT